MANQGKESTTYSIPSTRLGPCLLFLAIVINAAYQVHTLFHISTEMQPLDDDNGTSIIRSSTMEAPQRRQSHLKNDPINAYEEKGTMATRSFLLWDGFWDYLDWHQKQRQLWNATNYHNFRYLVMTCGKADNNNCGGAADRLRPSLALLRLAARTHRLFLIHWDHPAPLEQFLRPPQGGLDWRVPDWLLPKLQLHRKAAAGNLRGILKLAAGNSWVVPTKYQSPTYGAVYYNHETINNSTVSQNDNQLLSMDQVYSDFWRLLFTPAPSVADKIRSVLHHLQLVPGQYTSIHVRTYTLDSAAARRTNDNDDATTAIKTMRLEVQNAIQCGRQLQQRDASLAPLFFSSDSMEAAQMAVKFGRLQHLNLMVRHSSPVLQQQNRTTSNAAPIHLGFAADDASLHDLQDVFVDLYLLALGRCVAYGNGGFGEWAYLIQRTAAPGGGRNRPRCGFRHGKRGRTCPDRRTEAMLVTQPAPNHQDDTFLSTVEPLFLPPMVT